MCADGAVRGPGAEGHPGGKPPAAGRAPGYDAGDRPDGLVASELAADPMRQFGRWLAGMSGSDAPEPTAMILSTASAGGRPSSRSVLLKAHDEHGFVFYTNDNSRKGVELTENPRASLLFPWYSRHRQVIAAGPVRRVSRDRSAEYFHSRPRGSQLGAWASERQSSVIASRESLERRFADCASRWPEGTEVPLPDFWGGWLLVPDEVEFWQGRADRLHDRLRYRFSDGTWAVDRLSP